MSVDGNGSKAQPSVSTAPVDNARAALVGLLKRKRIEKAPSQDALAKKLKKEIEDLRAIGVSFEAISEHLKESGIIISKKTLGAAVKKKSRRPKGGASSRVGSPDEHPSNVATSK